MSTKIYNAYLFHGNLVQLQKSLEQIKKQWEKEQVQLWCKAFTGMTTDKQVGDWLVKHSTIILPERLQERFIDATRVWTGISSLDPFIEACHDCPVNIAPWGCDASAIVYPFKSKLIVQFFGINPKSRLYKDFYYQNQTDHPSRISEQEWNQREKIWEKIFSNDSSPADTGFVYEIYNTMSKWRVVEAVKKRVKLEKRTIKQKVEHV
jgi:hypothetical protein